MFIKKICNAYLVTSIYSPA